MKQGVITVITKPGKDKRQLNYLRPIVLLNTDYKILSGAIAARPKNGIAEIMSETQSVFLKGRSVHNIKLVLESLEYDDLFEEGGLILFLDFYKTFDRV